MNKKLCLLAMLTLGAVSTQNVVAAVPVVKKDVVVTRDGLTLNVGSDKTSAGESGTAIGVMAQTGKNGVAVGAQTKASGANSTAVGVQAQANGGQSTAVGVQAQANGPNTTAVGTWSHANAKGSVALGVNSETEQQYTDTTAKYTGDQNKDASWGVVSVGNSTNIQRRITNVAGGVNKTDAANIGQLDVVNQKTEDNKANIATNSTNIAVNSKNITQLNRDVKNLNTRVDELSGRIGGVESKINRLDEREQKHMAQLMAAAGLFQPYNVGRLSVTAAVGQYRSHTALAVGAGYRFNERFAVKTSASMSTEDTGDAGYNVGMQYEF